jgi:hypothetical protein
MWPFGSVRLSQRVGPPHVAYSVSRASTFYYSTDYSCVKTVSSLTVTDKLSVFCGQEIERSVRRACGAFRNGANIM